jgi:ABC-type transport system involved in multi-copper enzyme maturation permease subunit
MHNRKIVFLAFLVLALSSLAFAGVGRTIYAVSSFCGGLTSLLPVAAMLMVIIAAVLYAAGQMMGAETRARANVWSTACVVGAIIAILIVVVSPSVMKTIYGQSVSCEMCSAADTTVGCLNTACTGSQFCCFEELTNADGSCAQVNFQCLAANQACSGSSQEGAQTLVENPA